MPLRPPRYRTLSVWYVLLLPIPAILLTGCTADTGGHRFVQRSEGDVATAFNSGGPRYQGELFRFEEQAVLIQDEERPESLIYPRASRRWDEKGFLMDEFGRYYVQDRGNRRIAVFDREGHFGGRIGGPGQGPGEFVFPHLHTLTGDTLEVYDESLHRFTFYRTDGRLIETRPSPVSGGRVYFDRRYKTFTTRDFREERTGDLVMLEAGFCTYDASGTKVGEAHAARIPMYYTYAWAGHKGGEGASDLPFTAYPGMAWTSDGIYLVDGLNPVVIHCAVDGTLLRRITLELEEIPVTREDRAVVTRELEARIADSTGDEHDRLLGEREALSFPERKSRWSGIQVDDAGYMWLEVPPWVQDLEGLEEGQGPRYQLLSPEGEYLGITRAPAHGKVMRGHLLGVRVDPESGREDYVAWRMRTRAGGFVYP